MNPLECTCVQPTAANMSFCGFTDICDSKHIVLWNSSFFVSFDSRSFVANIRNWNNSGESKHIFLWVSDLLSPLEIILDLPFGFPINNIISLYSHQYYSSCVYWRQNSLSRNGSKDSSPDKSKKQSNSPFLGLYRGPTWGLPTLLHTQVLEVARNISSSLTGGHEQCLLNMQQIMIVKIILITKCENRSKSDFQLNPNFYKRPPKPAFDFRHTKYKSDGKKTARTPLNIRIKATHTHTHTHTNTPLA